jgi:hypothetical protein
LSYVKSLVLYTLLVLLILRNEGNVEKSVLVPKLVEIFQLKSFEVSILASALFMLSVKSTDLAVLFAAKLS